MFFRSRSVMMFDSDSSPTPPAPPAERTETRYKYEGDDDWRTVMIGGSIDLIDDMVDPSGQIDNPNSIVAIEIGTGTQENPLTSIGEEAFSQCNKLTSVTIPSTVTTIEDDAFSYCKGLTSIAIPDNVASIGKYAF